MTRPELYEQAGVPTSLLGCPWRRWRVFELQAVLNYYGVFPGPRATKLELMRELHQLTQWRTVTKRDKMEILAGNKEERASTLSAPTEVVGQVVDPTAYDDPAASDVLPEYGREESAQSEDTSDSHLFTQEVPGPTIDD